MSEDSRTQLAGAVNDARTIRQRDRVVELRIRCQNALSDLKASMGHFEQSQAQFMLIAERTVQGSPEETLRTAQRTLREDTRDMGVQIERVQLMCEQLSRIDFALIQDEQQRSNAPEADFDAFLTSSGPQDTPIGLVDDSTSSDDGSLPSRLENYFEALGEIRLLRERLHDELPSEQADKRAMRELAKDQDRPLSETDEEFRAGCLTERLELEEELRDLIRRADGLHAECLNSGLDPNPALYIKNRGMRSSLKTDSVVHHWLDVLESPDNRSTTSTEGVSRGVIPEDYMPQHLPRSLEMLGINGTSSADIRAQVQALHESSGSTTRGSSLPSVMLFGHPHTLSTFPGSSSLSATAHPFVPPSEQAMPVSIANEEPDPETKTLGSNPDAGTTPSS